MSKLTQSKSKFDFFKADWVNVNRVGIAKLIVIYFINFKRAAACDPNILFIFLYLLCSLINYLF